MTYVTPSTSRKSALKKRENSLPTATSLEPHTRTRPTSCGAQKIELTDESWLLYS